MSCCSDLMLRRGEKCLEAGLRAQQVPDGGSEIPGSVSCIVSKEVLGWWGSSCGLMQTLCVNVIVKDAVSGRAECREGCKEASQVIHCPPSHG